jgi:hypothetical protein
MFSLTVQGAVPVVDLTAKLVGQGKSGGGISGTAKFHLVNKLQTLEVQVGGLAKSAGQTITIGIVRGKTSLPLTRATIAQNGTASTTLRLSPTSIRNGDIVQITVGGSLVAGGTFGASKN